jgi:hypothetical protein
MGITSLGDTGLRDSLRRWAAELGKAVDAGNPWGEAGGVEWLENGRVTSSATEEGGDVLLSRIEHVSHSVHLVSDSSVWNQQQPSRVVSSSCSAFMFCCCCWRSWVSWLSCCCCCCCVTSFWTRSWTMEPSVSVRVYTLLSPSTKEGVVSRAEGGWGRIMTLVLR